MHIIALEKEVKDKEQVMLKATDVCEITQEHKAATYSKRKKLDFSKAFKLKGELLSLEDF